MRALLILALVGCSAGPPGPGIDVDRAMGHVQALTAIGPRVGDSDAAARAAVYLEQQLTSARATVERHPVGTIDVPRIELLGRIYRPAKRIESKDPNLLVRLGPPGKALLLMAHYDTVAGSPGAIDNAAANAVLVELARVLVATPPTTPVILAFTANEEPGLVGAEALAKQLGAEVSFVISLDLLGGSGDLSLNGASTLIGSLELRWLANAADRAGIALRAPLAHRVISRWWPQLERSDHSPFTRAGIRAVHLYHRGSDGEWIDLAYHSEHDQLARVQRASVEEVGRYLRALTVGAPPQHSGSDGMWLPGVTNTVIPRWLLIAFEGLLIVLALASLLSVRGAFVRGGLGLVAGAGVFALCAAGTLVLERAYAGEHVAPWLHDPARFAFAELLVLFGSLGFVTALARRIRPWSGDVRYLVIAVGVPLLVGCLALAIGAAEIAWVWLVPAALMAIAPRLGRARVLGVLAQLLPLVLVLHPNQLREAAWNGFLPMSVQLALWLAVFSLPVAAGVAWYLRRRTGGSPLGAFVLPLGCLLAIAAGVVLVSRAHPPCSAANFNEFHLRCERSPGVR